MTILELADRDPMDPRVPAWLAVKVLARDLRLALAAWNLIGLMMLGGR